MRKDVARDFNWQMPFMPQAAKIAGRALAPHVFIIAPPDKDMKENSDLVLVARDIRIACRMRRMKYYPRYANDITFRWRENGQPSDLKKMLDGYGHAFFYGFVSEEKIESWRLVSLNKIRCFFSNFVKSDGWTPHDLVDFAFHNGLANGCGYKSNNDGTGFVYFDLTFFDGVMSDAVLDANPPIQELDPYEQAIRNLEATEAA